MRKEQRTKVPAGKEAYTEKERRRESVCASVHVRERQKDRGTNRRRGSVREGGGRKERKREKEKERKRDRENVKETESVPLCA